MNKPHVRCMVCRERMRPGENYYQVDGRCFCPDCAEVYNKSHYPEMRVEEFRREYEHIVPAAGGIPATA